jgi:hypothetical protein
LPDGAGRKPGPLLVNRLGEDVADVHALRVAGRRDRGTSTPGAKTLIESIATRC